MSTHTPPPPQCRLYHMEYIARHGTRFVVVVVVGGGGGGVFFVGCVLMWIK